MQKILIIFSLSIFCFSCSKDKVEEVTISAEDCPETISYTNDIQTFLDINCTTSGCHNANSNAAGYTLETHSQVEEHADIILSVIRHESGFSAMPQGAAKLSDEVIRKMECWINQGKLFN
jgi:hypothetical protein